MALASGEWNFIMFTKNDKYHRTDGPAKIWRSGYKEWWFDGNFQRVKYK